MDAAIPDEICALLNADSVFRQKLLHLYEHWFWSSKTPSIYVFPKFAALWPCPLHFPDLDLLQALAVVISSLEQESVLDASWPWALYFLKEKDESFVSVATGSYLSPYCRARQDRSPEGEFLPSDHVLSNCGSPKFTLTPAVAYLPSSFLQPLNKGY